MKRRRLAVEVLFPKVRAKIFQLLFGDVARAHYVRELALRSHLALHTIQDELRKLSALGLVTSRSNGFQRYYQANRRHALYPAISQIVTLSKQLPRPHEAQLARKPEKGPSKRARRRRGAHLKMSYEPINWGTLAPKS